MYYKCKFYILQVVDLSEGETEWLANHMGHALDIHKDTYRLHDRTIEAAKISRLLLAIEKGDINKYKGRKLKDIGMCGKLI